MDRNDRPLRTEFLDAMALHAAWPKAPVYETWIRDHAPPPCDRIKSGVYGEMRGGYAIESRHALGLAFFLVDRIRARAEDGEPKHPAVRKALTAFLAPGSVDDPTWTAELLAQRILAEEETDYMSREIEGFMTLLMTYKKTSRVLRGCATATDVEEAVKWLFVFCGRSLRADLRLRNDADAIYEAVKEFGIELRDFQDRAIGWWRAVPWSIVLALGKRQPTGMSIVLPVSEHVYRELRDGRREGFQIAPDELVFPSRNVVLEGTCERSADSCSEPGNYTKHTLPAIITQVAALTYSQEEAKTPIRALSFSATPRSRYRLEGAGYGLVGTRMPLSGIEFYEKELAPDSEKGFDFAANLFFPALGKRARRHDGPPL